MGGWENVPVCFKIIVIWKCGLGPRTAGIMRYLQRGGSPTFRDRMLATDCGMMAVELLAQGIGNRAIGEVNGKIVHLDLAKALKAKRSLREELFQEIHILSK